jgi:hypothetical protein
MVSFYIVSLRFDRAFYEINSLELARRNTPKTIQLKEVVPMIDLV